VSGLDMMQHEYEEYRRLIDEQLAMYFTGDRSEKTLTDAMRYSLLAGGKRVRPVLLLQFARAAGGSVKAALPAACAVEMLHTYSLIHDDLPCMDNDALRRGKPTNHIVFGECVATLAGDALQAEAFGTLYQSELPADVIVKMGRILAKAAGRDGICGGQTLDMKSEGKQISRLEMERIHELKTSTLLAASVKMGVAAAQGTPDQTEAAEKYAEALGLAFQIRDDILDYTATTEVLGKPAGSDCANNKTTFVTLFGIAECERIVCEKTREAVSSLAGHFANTEFLSWFARNLEERKY
jgi:geranylgeranyl diphosphate synthase type II